MIGAFSFILAVGCEPLALAGQYDRTDYGRRIEGIGGDTEVWWCEAAWKIAPNRTAPQATSSTAALAAARDDREAVQIVLRPGRELRQLTATAGVLSGPDGATIPAENIQVLRVYYHYVRIPGVSARAGLTRRRRPTGGPMLCRPSISRSTYPLERTNRYGYWHTCRKTPRRETTPAR